MDRPREFLRSSLRLQGARSSALDRDVLPLRGVYRVSSATKKEREREKREDERDRRDKLFCLPKEHAYKTAANYRAHGQYAPRSPSANLNRVSLDAVSHFPPRTSFGVRSRHGCMIIARKFLRYFPLIRTVILAREGRIVVSVLPFVVIRARRKTCRSEDFGSQE